MIDANAILALRREAGFFDGFRLVVLFGSVARGTASGESDVDLGILGSGALTLADEAAFQRRIEERLGCSVDLVRLDQADPMLRWRVARDGVVIHSAPALVMSLLVALQEAADIAFHIAADEGRWMATLPTS